MHEIPVLQMNITVRVRTWAHMEVQIEIFAVHNEQNKTIDGWHNKLRNFLFYFIHYNKDFEDGIQSGRKVTLPNEWQRFNKTRLIQLFSLIFKWFLEGNDLGFWFWWRLKDFFYTKANLKSCWRKRTRYVV